MHRLYILFLVSFLFSVKTIGQSTFEKQHEKFIRLHRTAPSEQLLKILQTEEHLLAKKRASNSDRAKLALDRGIYFYMLFEFPKCIAPFEQALKLNCLTSDRDKILVYCYLGVSYQHDSNNAKNAHAFLNKAIDLADKKKNYELLTSAVVKKAFVYYSHGQLAQGIRLLESFSKKTRAHLTVKERSSIHGMLAQGYNRLGNHAKSYLNYTEAIELAEKTKNVELIVTHHYELMHFFVSQDRTLEAKKRLLYVIQLLEDQPRLENKLYDSYGALGQIYSTLNQPDSALYYVNLTHNHALKTGDIQTLCFSYGALGNIYYDQKEYSKALDFLLKSMEYEDQFFGVTNRGTTYNNIGAVYLDMKNYAQAIIYFQKSRSQAYLEGDISGIYSSYDNLSEVYRRSGNLEQVIAMTDSALVYYDSLNRMETKKELLRLEVSYETKLKAKENKLLKLEVKKQQEAQRDMILLGIVVILLLLGIVYILYIQNRLRKSKVSEAQAKIQNQKLEEELLHKRLHLLTEEINRKNQLIQSLESGANSLTEENLLNKVTLENDWLAFMTEFDKVHAGYLSNLKKQFPDLTTNNLRLAALVKLEFSNKEIAIILCITENGVKKAKQRLKERIKMD